MYVGHVLAEARQALILEEFKFKRSPDIHACWETPEHVRSYSSVQLYVCFGCGRSHHCQPPYDTCPRIVPYRNPKAICAFSGREVGDSAELYVAGSYDLEIASVQAICDAWREQRHKRTEEEEVAIAVKGPINSRAQQQMRYQAGIDTNTSRKKNKLRLADDMVKRSEGIHAGDAFLRLKEKSRPSRQQLEMKRKKTRVLELDMDLMRPIDTTANDDDDDAMEEEEKEDNEEDYPFPYPQGEHDFDPQAIDMIDMSFASLFRDSKNENDSQEEEERDISDSPLTPEYSLLGSGGGNDKPMEFAPQNAIDAMDIEQEDESFGFGGGGGGGGDLLDGERETALTHNNGTSLHVPRTELIQDDLYWIRVLDPITSFIQARRSVFDHHETQVAAQANHEDDDPNKQRMRQRTMLETRRYVTPRLLWPLMRSGTPVKEMLKHQRSIFSMVETFLKHYQPLLLIATREQKTTIPLPMSVEEYAIRIDRILDLYNCFNRDSEMRLSPQHDLSLQRVVLTCLTSLFVKPSMVRDADHVQVFLWQADPFLLACEKARLFSLVPPPISHFTPSAAAVIGTTTNPNSRQKTSQLLNVIQETGFTAHHLHAVFNQFT